MSSLWRGVFLRFWVSRTVGFVGVEVALFALPLLAVTSLHATASEVGVLATAQTLPFLLFGLVAGAWVDRWPRLPLLALVDVARAMVFGVIAVLAWWGQLTMPVLWVAAFVIGAFTVVATVGYQSAVLAIAGRHRLVAANAQFEAGSGAAEAIGPALGGALVQWGSVAAAFVLNAVALACAAVLLPFEKDERVAPDATRPQGVLREVIEGLRLVHGNRTLRPVVLCACVDNLLGVGLFGPLFILYATNTLHVAPAALGAIFTMTGLGALIGAFWAPALTERYGMRRVLVAVQLATAGVRLAMASVSAGPFVVAVLMAVECANGFMMPLFNVNLMSLRQASVRPDQQGRINATVGFLLWGATPVGALFAGLAGDVVGVKPVLMMAAIATAGASVLLVRVPAHLGETPASGEPAPSIAG